MKICIKCSVEKEDLQFNHHNKNTCRDCRIAYSRKHYQDNKKYYKDKTIRHKNIFIKQIKELIFKIKDNPCMDCGIKFHHSAMDFDHIKGEKLFNISSFSSKNVHKSSINKILEEIEKCELVCANCHRVRTFNRREQNQNATLV